MVTFNKLNVVGSLEMGNDATWYILPSTRGAEKSDI